MGNDLIAESDKFVEIVRGVVGVKNHGACKAVVENEKELGKGKDVQILDYLNVGVLGLFGDRGYDPTEPEGGLAFEIEGLTQLGQQSRNSQHMFFAIMFY